MRAHATFLRLLPLLPMLAALPILATLNVSCDASKSSESPDTPGPQAAMADDPFDETPAPVLGVSVFVEGADKWHCEPGAAQHQYQPLSTGQSRCENAGDCQALADVFDALCALPAPTADAMITIVDEPVRCRRQQHGPPGCFVSCFHRTEGLDRDELERRFELHVQGVRNLYGRDQSAAIQGVASSPRREHRFYQNGGRDELRTRLVLNLCPPTQRSAPHEFRTYYHHPG